MNKSNYWISQFISRTPRSLLFLFLWRMRWELI